MFAFRRPIAAVMAGLITVFIGLCLDVAFASTWTLRHAAAFI